MPNNLPYVTSPGTLEIMLEKIVAASVPERFTQDFVSTKLGMKGGTARAIIPFIKKMGFVASDGSPTELYKEYRNHTKSGGAIARTLKTLYHDLYDMNEYAHALNDNELGGLIVQATGAQKSSDVVKKTIVTFKTLKKQANFEDVSEPQEIETIDHINTETPKSLHTQFYQSTPNNNEGINLSYTINLNLPATQDIEVFNAIFKSLKEHLLQK